MARPLWRILLPILILTFAAHRLAVALFLDARGQLISAGFLLQAVSAVLLALGIWLGARWVLGAVLALGISIAATACLAMWTAGVFAWPYLSQVLVTAVATGILFLVLRHEFYGARGTDEEGP